MNSDFYKQNLFDSQSETMGFQKFLDMFFIDPEKYLYTSSSLIAESVRHFGYNIVIRSGEPVISYHLFEDPFSDGINAIYGQEFCSDKILDIIDSANQESLSYRGIVLVGPPSSGKTNIIDMVAKAVEEYTKDKNIHIYTFYFDFDSLQIRSPFVHNPLLLIPISMSGKNGIIHPRKDMIDGIVSDHGGIFVPNYYKNASLDKASLDIIDELMRVDGLSYYEVIEKYVKIEEIDFSLAQGKGISNIDSMDKLKVNSRYIEVAKDKSPILEKILSVNKITSYNSAIINSNRGMLHIHDAFKKHISEDLYQPLLMLLGSGKITLDATQTCVDTTVFITTNLEEMKVLQEELTSTKFLDRIEKVSVNYLVDVNSEMKILERDMSGLHKKYDIDPNLIRIASYYSIITRLFPPHRKEFPNNWSEEKKDLYNSLSPEQKMFIYSSQCIDPIKTIQNLPTLHHFRNECFRLGIDLSDQKNFADKILKNENATTLEESGLFDNNDIAMINDEFMRTLVREHYPNEGKHGISVRQLQNIMRDTIAASDGSKLTVNQFFKQLRKIVSDGSSVYYWLQDDHISKMNSHDMEIRTIGDSIFDSDEGNYGDYESLIEVIESLYSQIIKREITIATVDRDPIKIEGDLRRYIQHVLLSRAMHNKSFSKIMVEKYSFIDPVEGKKVDKSDEFFMKSIEKILCVECEASKDVDYFRNLIADKFFKAQSAGDLKIDDGSNVINSRNDNLTSCFSSEYTTLLSHRKIIDGINSNALENAFFLKFNQSSKYNGCSKEIQDMVENILNKMKENNKYSKEMALETVVYALSEEVVDFSEIIM